MKRHPGIRVGFGVDLHDELRELTRGLIASPKDFDRSVRVGAVCAAAALDRSIKGTDWRQSDLAKIARVAPETFARHVNKPEHGGVLNRGIHFIDQELLPPRRAYMRGFVAALCVNAEKTPLARRLELFSDEFVQVMTPGVVVALEKTAKTTGVDMLPVRTLLNEEMGRFNGWRGIQQRPGEVGVGLENPILSYVDLANADMANRIEHSKPILLNPV